jgi:predicted RNA-binding protein with TRAM domain
MKRTFKINDISRRHAAKAVMDAPLGYVVTIAEAAKSREQEQKYHAMIADIAAQYRFCERYWDAEDMKRLLLDQFRRETGKDEELAVYWMRMGNVTMAPSLDGSGVVALGTQSRKFPKPLATAFIEWLYAFGAGLETPIIWTDSDPFREAAA